MHVLYAISDMLSVLTFPNELRQENDSETKKYSHQAAQKKGRENKMRDGGDPVGENYPPMQIDKKGSTFQTELDWY